jgi:hypothetical protein
MASVRCPVQLHANHQRGRIEGAMVAATSCKRLVFTGWYGMNRFYAALSSFQN